MKNSKKLRITGRRWGETVQVGVIITPLMRDTLKMYAIIKGLPGGARGAICDILDNNEQIVNIKKFLAKEQSSEKRSAILAELTQQRDADEKELDKS